MKKAFIIMTVSIEIAKEVMLTDSEIDTLEEVSDDMQVDEDTPAYELLLSKIKKSDFSIEAINGITDFQLLTDSSDEPTAKPIFRMEYEGKEIKDAEGGVENE